MSTGESDLGTHISIEIDDGRVTSLLPYSLYEIDGIIFRNDATVYSVKQ